VGHVDVVDESDSVEDSFLNTFDTYVPVEYTNCVLSILVPVLYLVLNNKVVSYGKLQQAIYPVSFYSQMPSYWRVGLRCMPLSCKRIALYPMFHGIQRLCETNMCLCLWFRSMNRFHASLDLLLCFSTCLEKFRLPTLSMCFHVEATQSSLIWRVLFEMFSNCCISCMTLSGIVLMERNPI